MEKVADCPATTDMLIGCAAIDGAVSVAGEDVSEALAVLALVKPTHPVWTRQISNKSGAVAKKNR